MAEPVGTLRREPSRGEINVSPFKGNDLAQPQARVATRDKAEELSAALNHDGFESTVEELN